MLLLYRKVILFVLIKTSAQSVLWQHLIEILFIFYRHSEQVDRTVFFKMIFRSISERYLMLKLNQPCLKGEF